MKLRQTVYRKLSILLILLMAASFVMPSGAVSAAVSTKDAAVKFLQNDFETRGVQNNDSGVGSYALFVLNEAGVDVSSWVYDGISLKDAVTNAVSDDINNEGAKSAKTLAQDLAAAIALNATDEQAQLLQILKNRQNSGGFDTTAYSEYGNLAAFDYLGRLGKMDQMNQTQAKSYILGLANTTVSDANYGSWPSSWPDLIATAEAIRALHYLDPTNSDAEIQAGIENGQNWLKKQQKSDGSFSASEYDDPLIDTCEVVMTLKVLGTDPATWTSSSGKTAIDYLNSSALNPDGSFGTSKNDMDVTWFLAANNLITYTPDSPGKSAADFLYNDYTNRGMNNTDTGVGSYALYVLSEAGVDVSPWVYNGTSLKNAVTDAVSNDISNQGAKSAKTLAQDLAVAIALNATGEQAQLLQILKNRQNIGGFDTTAYSEYGNLAAFDYLGRLGKMDQMNQTQAKSYILGLANTTVSDANYGSWPSSWPDLIATAEAIRALHYLDPTNSDAEIQAGIENGQDWLKKLQQADGSFSASEYDDPLIDTCEVVMTLKVLGTDPTTWTSSSGKTAIDYLNSSALNPDGSFGTSKNDMDATWFLAANNLLDTQFYIDPSGATMNTGEKKQFKAIWKNANGTTDVSQYADWSAGDGGIVSIDSHGLVSALKAGQTVVKAVYNGVAASVALTVSSLSNPGGGTVPTTTKKVNLAVVGSSGELLFSPSSVSVAQSNKWGLTVLGALDSSGISYHSTNASYGVLVDSIKGQASSGLSGWMYVVNGQIPGVSSEKYNINSGDNIIWYFSKSMDQQPPKWDDLVNRNQTSSGSTGAQTPVQPVAPVSDTSLNAAVRNADSIGMVVLQADNTQTALALSNDQLSKILSTGKPLAVTVQGVRFVLSADSLKVPEMTAANASQLQLNAQKLGTGDTQSLIEPFADRLKSAGDVYELNALVVNKDSSQQKIKQFPDCKISLPVPEALRAAAATGKIMAYWYNEDSEVWEQMGGTYDAAGGTISFKTNHFSKYALMEDVSQGYFKDVAGHWGQKEIEFMAAKGYVVGVSDKKFAPDNKVTRAEFVTILTRVAGLKANPDGAARFSDVPVNAWYRGAVGAAVNAGLANGVGKDEFAPDQLITREQMAAMIVQLMAKNGLNTYISDADAVKALAKFTDKADISSWARIPAAFLVQQQLMSGRASNRLVPLGDATRAEAAAVLYRALQKLPQLGK
jgi:prenyltransferase beta subunit